MQVQGLSAPPSHHNLIAMIGVAEVGRGTALALLEDTVEVGDIVEARLVTDLHHRHGGIDQEAGCIPEANVDDIIGERTPGPDLEEPAEGRGGHTCHVGHGRKTYLIAEMLVDVVLHLTDAATVGRCLDGGERCGGEEVEIGLDGELVEYFHQLQDTGETGLQSRQFIEFAIDAHDGGQTESDAALGILKQLLERGHLTLGQELLTQQVGRELDHVLTHFSSGSNIDQRFSRHLFPSMLEVTADEGEVKLLARLDAVAHNAAHACAVLHEGKFQLDMLVQGVVVGLLQVVEHIETVLFRKGCDFCNDGLHATTQGLVFRAQM